MNLEPCEVDDYSWYVPALDAYLHTGAAAVEMGYQVPEGVDIAIDTETPSKTDSFTIKCFTASWAQNGLTHAILLDPLRNPEHADVVRTVCSRARWLIGQNTPFDVPGLVAARLMTLDQCAKVQDTLVYARSAWPDTIVPKNLEALAARVLGMTDLKDSLKMAQKASGLTSAEKWYAQGDIHMPTYRMGAMSDTVVTLRLAAPLYEAAVNRQLDHPFSRYGMTDRASAGELVLKAQRVNQIMLRPAAKGYVIDPEYQDSYVDQVQIAREKAVRTLTAHGLRPGVGLDIVKYLQDQGALPGNWPRTKPSKTRPDGTLKSDKKSLERLPDHPLAVAHRMVAHTDKMLGYMEKVTARSRVTGRLHPQWQILGASATGRMCLPVTHSLVTQRGVVEPDDIRIGDLTLDKSGAWVPVRAVHRYPEAEIETREWRNFRMECTPEHRWVTHVDGGRCRIEPLTGVRRRVQLIPDEKPIDLTGRTLRQSLATLIGLLVSDGRCAVSGREMRASVYQTEGGFYRTMRDAIPDGALMYDRITADTGRGPHHEMRIRTRWLRPRLESEGLTVTSVLARCEGLAAWVMRQDMAAVRDFFTAVYLSDGNTSRNELKITCEHPETQRAIQLAAYRLGYRAYVRYDPASKWGTKPRAYVRLTTQDIQVRATAVTRTTADVWCVTTDSGTFTAWNGQPYLTGNSCVEPELQQFSAEARPIICCNEDSAGLHSVDWTSIEPALLGWMAHDWGLIDPFEAGADIYEPVQRSAGCTRKTAKVVVLAQMYGQGRDELAASLGCSVEQAVALQRQMRAAMPVAARYMGKIKQIAVDHGLALTVSGRVLTISTFKGEVKAYKAVNSTFQGSCADLLYETILNAAEAGLGDEIMLPMHDEIVCSSEAAEEVQRIMSIPPAALIERMGGRIPVIRTDSQALGRAWRTTD